ncbi:MAG: CotH kinase family protein [Ignavibacteriales bacterium]|nr:CotH kinase family protein [Ignavibacteriales bacterium]
MRYIFLCLIGISVNLFAQVEQYSATMLNDDYRLLFTRDIFSDSLLPASFENQGNYWNDAQIRFKGHSTRYYPKKSYRIKFNKNNLFQNMQSINFNAMYTDKSYLREKLAWELYAELNQLAPHAEHARFSMNGNEGLYLFIEKVDKYFLQNRGRKIAPMYEANDTYISADLTIQPDNVLKMYYDKEIGNAADYSDLAQLISAINSASDATFRDTVYKYFDVSSILNWFTGNILTMMGDSYNKNYLLYRDTSKVTQQWTIIPWDYDLSFGRSGDLAIPYPGSLLNDGFAYTFEPLAGPSNVLKDRFITTPSLWEELRLHVDSSLNTIFTEEHLSPRIDSLATLVENYVSLDNQKWGTIQDFYDHVEALKYYVTARRNYLKKTFINPPSGEYNRVTVPISQIGIPYHFIAYDGRQIATLWFTEFQGLDSILVQAHPESVPPGIVNPSDEKFVKRWIEIIPYPSTAQFTAKLQWMYSDVSSLDREVGTGVQDERLLRCYSYDGRNWNSLSSKVNYFGNFVTVDSITQNECGAGKHFALMMPETYTQKWFRQPLNFWQKWYDIQFADSLIGFIVGEHGTILKTTDRGSTWVESNVGLALPLTSIGIASFDNIFVVAENGFMFRSNDTGKSWSRIILTQNKNIRGFLFESPQNGWVYGDSAQLMKTTDGGLNWLLLTLNSTKNIAGIARKGANLLIIYFEDGYFATSTDEGQTWIPDSNGTGKKITCVKSDGISHWILGENGTVICISMYGESFDRSVGTLATLRDMEFFNSGEMYVAGGGGKIFYTTNGGIDWYSQYTADSHDLYGMTFTNSTHGFAIGNGGTILTTSSEGTVTDVKNIASSAPSEIRLYQNYPNPFNPVTDIRYQISTVSHVMLKVYDVLGREVATLVNEIQDAGFKSVKWNAADFSSGIYFYSLTITGDNGSMFHDVKKLVLLK